MPNLTPQSPLLQPIQWQGQEYFTSQYFHRQYVDDSPHGGKYQRFDHFMHAVRNIPAYALFQEAKAIVELRWPAFKQEQTAFVGSFKPLFQATGWNPITLLNATAQAELFHHLDNELSQQMALASSTMVARQMTRKPHNLLPMEQATRELKAGLEAATLFGIPPHIAQQEVVKMIEAGSSGVSFRAMLLASPAQTNIVAEDKMLEPTELAKALGLPSAIALNRALEDLGWQIKRIGGGWEVTPTGAPYAAQHAWIHGAKSGYNWVWRIETTRAALITAGVIAS